MLRIRRLWLLPLLVALLPLHGWAGDDTRPTHAAVDTVAMLIVPQDDCGDLPGGGGTPSVAEAGEAAPTGADLAEHLLPASAPRLAPLRSRGGPPAYAGLTLPDPDLPLLPRPPRG